MMAERNGSQDPNNVPAAVAVDIEVNNDTVEDEGQAHNVAWYETEYKRLDADGFESEWERGALLVVAKKDLGNDYKKFMSKVLGKSERHAQRWIKVVKTFTIHLEKGETTIEELSHVGMTKLFFVTTLAANQWRFSSTHLEVRKNDSSTWVNATRKTAEGIESLNVKKQDPFQTVQGAIDEYRTIADYGSPEWKASLRSLYNEHHADIQKRIKTLGEEIDATEQKLDDKRDVKSDLEAILGEFEHLESDVQRENVEIKAEVARLQKLVEQLTADRQHEDQRQEIDSNAGALPTLAFK